MKCFENDYVFVANRNDTTVSRIASETEEVTNLRVQSSNSLPEPMYIVHCKNTHEIWVGMRGLNEIHVYCQKTLDLKTKIQVIPGIFHMAANDHFRYVAVVCDTSKKIVIISTKDYTTIKTIDLPVDLSTYVPHDVVISEFGIYVSLIGQNNGYVIRYGTQLFNEENRIQVGNVPHLFTGEKYRHLYIVSETDGMLYKVGLVSFVLVKQLPIPGAHGIYGTYKESRLYVSNVKSINGSQSLYHVLTDDLTIANVMDSLVKNPHNLMLNKKQNKLYVTHSFNTSTSVTIYDLDAAGVIDSGTIVNTGLNPFGLMLIE